MTYKFVAPDGSITEYNLDENMIPYKYINEEVVYLALPLEHLKVTDTKKIEELNAELKGDKSKKSSLNSEITTYSVPTYYYDMSTGRASENSIKYTRVVSFLSTTSVPTSVLKLNTNHEAIRIKTYNLTKEHWYSGVTIDLRHYYYHGNNDTWYTEYFSNKDCTGSTGWAFQHSPELYSYQKFDVIKNGGLQSFDLDIWTTYAW